MSTIFLLLIKPKFNSKFNRKTDIYFFLKFIFYRFPWLNVDDIELGCLGLEKEGWFDPYSLLSILKKGALEKGAGYVKGEVVDFVFDDKADIIIEGSNRAAHQVIKKVVVSNTYFGFHQLRIVLQIIES